MNIQLVARRVGPRNGSNSLENPVFSKNASRTTPWCSATSQPRRAVKVCLTCSVRGFVAMIWESPVRREDHTAMDHIQRRTPLFHPVWGLEILHSGVHPFLGWMKTKVQLLTSIHSRQILVRWEVALWSRPWQTRREAGGSPVHLPSSVLVWWAPSRGVEISHWTQFSLVEVVNMPPTCLDRRSCPWAQLHAQREKLPSHFHKVSPDQFLPVNQNAIKANTRSIDKGTDLCECGNCVGTISP